MLRQQLNPSPACLQQLSRTATCLRPNLSRLVMSLAPVPSTRWQRSLLSGTRGECLQLNSRETFPFFSRSMALPRSPRNGSWRRWSRARSARLAFRSISTLRGALRSFAQLGPLAIAALQPGYPSWPTCRGQATTARRSSQAVVPGKAKSAWLETLARVFLLLLLNLHTAGNTWRQTTLVAKRPG
jgi:hypothetical protein